jgi:hypothetical protein
MAVFIVTYDLRGETEGQCYHKLIELIKEEGVWACLGGSSYLIVSDHTAVELRDKFKEALDSNDMLYVGCVSAPAAWTGYSKEVTEWIKEKL